MAEQKLDFPHTLTLNERSSLTMTGVSEVISFDDTSVVLHTSLGTLNIHGNDLQLKALSLDGGQVVINGSISALIYEQTHARQSLRQRLFG